MPYVMCRVILVPGFVCRSSRVVGSLLLGSIMMKIDYFYERF
tara:strand:- start:115 stop:240 length:126 start_codon:yes stop_codon:yes gene_type:complete